jgi:septum site-determining protein MinC
MKALKLIKKKQWKRKKTVEVKSEIVQGNDIYRGTLRSGQIIRSDGNLVIVGDINPGAEAEANGSIVVLGSLRGRAKAGIKDGDKAFVAALNLEPVLLIIGDHIARSPDKKESSRGIKPEMAYIKDEKMVIENIKII